MMRCAAGKLCKEVDKPVPMNSEAHLRDKAQHECAICGKGMHGMGDGCGVEADEVKSQLPDNVVNRMDTSKHLVCILCLSLESNKKDGASDMDIDTPPTNQNESRGDNNDMEVEVIAMKPSGTAKNNNKKKNQRQPTIFGAPLPPPPPPQNKGNTTGIRGKGGVNENTVQKTNVEKLAIMKEIDNRGKSVTVAKILKKHKVAPSTVSGWRRKINEITQSVEENRGKKKKVVLCDGLKRVKEGLKGFYELNDNMPNSCKIPITQSVISSQALVLKKTLLDKHKEAPFLEEYEVKALSCFDASLSWSSKFAKASGWKSKALHGEAGAVDVESCKQEMEQLRQKIATFPPENVFNMDETGLNFKILPNRSYVKEEDCKTARGTKLMKAKDRVTIFVTTNADGSDMPPLSIIGKSKNPRCFKNRQKKLRYYNQKKAWSDSKVFGQWWEWFQNYIRNRTNEKVLLILDNCGPHGSELVDPLGQIEVVFLPPNVTSVYQPMDAGIIAMLKKKYRYRLLMKILEIFEERPQRRAAADAANMRPGTKGLAEGYAPHLADVMDILHEVWKEISAQKVKNCWEKTTLVSFTDDTQTSTAATTPTVGAAAGSTAATTPTVGATSTTTTTATATATTNGDNNNEVASIKITSDAVEELQSWIVHKHVDLTTELEKEVNEVVVVEREGNEVEVEENKVGDGYLACLANLSDAQGTAMLTVNDESDEVEKIFGKVKDFVKKNRLQLRNSNDDLETALWEMALTIDECVGDEDDKDKMKEVLDNWVATEDSKFYQDTMKDEINALLDDEVLAGVKDVPDEDDDTEEAVDDSKMEADDVQAIPVDAVIVQDLTIQLKKLAVKIGDLEGDEFTPVSAEVFDAVNNLQSAFRKVENKRKSNKQDNRQGTLKPFMKK